MEKVIKLIIEYDGTNFFGWQRQSKLRSVQSEIEQILSKLLKKEIQIDGAGRTDAGVHAYGQVASFKAYIPMPLENLKLALNNYLSEDIYIKDLIEEKAEFHGRYSAIGKKYIYKVYNSDKRNVFLANYAYRYHYKLDLEKIIEASEYLIGKHDFKGFMASGSSVKSTIRTIEDIKIYKEDDMIIFEYTGDGFLYKMIRMITGQLLEIGNNRLSYENLLDTLETQSRKYTTKVAPANGLYLFEVYYKN